MEDPKVLLILGSDSDYNVMKDCIATLRRFEIKLDVVVCSAHRTPDKAHKIADGAYDKGYGCIIAAAGMAAHLPGVIAASTILPVIGVPVRSDTLGGIDAMLSMIQMPPGIPVATVAVNGATNAAILAVQILSLKYNELAAKLTEYKAELVMKVEKKNKDLQDRIDKDFI